MSKKIQEMINKAEGKVKVIDCLKNILIEETQRLKEMKEIAIKENIDNVEDICAESEKLIAYVDALKDMQKAIEESTEGYIDVIYDNLEGDIKEAEGGRKYLEDITEDMTCYPLDVEYIPHDINDVDSIPF